MKKVEINEDQLSRIVEKVKALPPKSGKKVIKGVTNILECLKPQIKKLNSFGYNSTEISKLLYEVEPSIKISPKTISSTINSFNRKKSKAANNDATDKEE